MNSPWTHMWKAASPTCFYFASNIITLESFSTLRNWEHLHFTQAHWVFEIPLVSSADQFDCIMPNCDPRQTDTTAMYLCFSDIHCISAFQTHFYVCMHTIICYHCISCICIRRRPQQIESSQAFYGYPAESFGVRGQQHWTINPSIRPFETWCTKKVSPQKAIHLNEGFIPLAWKSQRPPFERFNQWMKLIQWRATSASVRPVLWSRSNLTQFNICSVEQRATTPELGNRGAESTQLAWWLVVRW